jgi:hypothetical protein
VASGQWNIQLIVGGLVVGEMKAADAPDKLEPTIFGEATDTWTLSLTPEEVSASDFGVSVGFDGAGDWTIQVDAVEVTIYTESGLGAPRKTIMAARRELVLDSSAREFVVDAADRRFVFS